MLKGEGEWCWQRCSSFLPRRSGRDAIGNGLPVRVSVCLRFLLVRGTEKDVESVWFCR